MTGILFRKSNLQPSSALMDQRTEKLCCTGSCMYSMSNIACLKKMGSAEKINTRPLLGYMSVGSDFQSTPPTMEPNFLLQGAELLLVFPEGITPLNLFKIPLQITGLFIIIHVQNLYLSRLLLPRQRVPLLSNSFELISEAKFGHQFCNKGTVSCDEDDGGDLRELKLKIPWLLVWWDIENIPLWSVNYSLTAAVKRGTDNL